MLRNENSKIYYYILKDVVFISDIKKKIKIKFIIIPAIFMLITTLSSLIYLVFRNDGYFAEGNVTLAIVSLVMFLTGSLIAFEGLNNLRKN